MEPKVVKDAECSPDTPLIHGNLKKPIYGQGVEIEPLYPGKRETEYDKKIYLPKLLPLEEYDHIIVLFSAGKDSTAAYYCLRELGVPKEKIQIWHHDIDGGHPDRRMDWPTTQSYVEAFAEAEGIKKRISRRINGFWGEVYRIGASFPVEYEDDGIFKTCKLTPKQQISQTLRQQILDGALGEEREALKQYGCRRKFPAKSGDLSRRWCSAYLKIDVADAVIRNLEALGKVKKFPAKGSISNGRYCSPQLKREVADAVIRDLTQLEELSAREKFPAKSGCHQGRWCSGALKAQVQSGVMADLEETRENTKILIVSGERRGESAGRAKYNEMEVHRTNATKRAHRLVHQWRIVIDYTERDIWEVLKRHRVNCHPCYRAGWNRCSCMLCIFSLPRHWAGIRELFPDEFEAVCHDEEVLGFTLDNKKTLREYVGDASSCVCHEDPSAIEQLLTGRFTAKDIFISGEWRFPAGAFRGAEGGPC